MLSATVAGAQSLDEPPTLGATLIPSKLSLDEGERAAATRLQNGGSVPVSVTARVNLPGTRTPAVGWSAFVGMQTLEPGEWTEIAIELQDASPSDVDLDIRMGPATPLGMDAVTLRFPVPVDVASATTESTTTAQVYSVSAWLLGMIEVLFPGVRSE